VALNVPGDVAAQSQRLLETGERVKWAALAQGGVHPRFQIVFILAGGAGLRYAVGADGKGGWAEMLWSAVGAVTAGLLTHALTKRRAVLVTDRSVVVLECSRFRGGKPTRVRARLPSDTKIGTPSGTWTLIEPAGERLWVHEKWHGNPAAFVPVRLG
jgi:hypothetical protein